MKFTLDELFDAYDFLERRYGFTDGLDAEDARSAVAEVARLAKDERDVPAVIFYALVRRPMGLGDAWTRLPAVLAANYACHAGFVLTATLVEMHELRFPLCYGEMSLDELREWFIARMKPLAAP